MSNRRHQATLGAILALALSVGCGLPTQTPVPVTATPSPAPAVPAPTDPPPPTLTPIPPPPPTESARLIALTLRNDSTQEICSVFISLSSSAEWGNDWLGGTETIEPGRSRVFQVEEGRYDLLAENCDKEEIDVQYGFEIVGFPTWAVSEETTFLTLRNNSGETVCYVYISPTSETTWGSDWLGSSEVIPTGDIRVFDVPFETYDLRAEDCSSNSLSTRWSVEVTGPTDWIVYPPEPAAPPPPPPSSDGTVYLESYTSAGATCRISVWGNGQDFLLDAGPGSPASHVLPPGEYGWQAFFGPAGQTGANPMNLAPGGSCTFICYDTYVEWGCSP